MGNTNSTLYTPGVRRFCKALIIATLLTNASASQVDFDRIKCLNTIFNTWPADSPKLLRNSTLENPVISHNDCIATCGGGIGIVPDIIPRLTIWLLSVLVLLLNVQYPTAAESEGPRKCTWHQKIKHNWKRTQRHANVGFRAMAHVLGDPVDYNLSLLYHVEAWSRCLQRAKRLRHPDGRVDIAQENGIDSIAVIISSFDWILDHANTQSEAISLFGKLVDGLKKPGGETSSAVELEDATARQLVVIRSRNPIPAVVAVILYAWTVTGAFVPVIGASPYPSGGRVAYAILLSWIIFAVLLNNTVGVVTSREAFAGSIRGHLRRQYLENPEASPQKKIDQLVHVSLGSTYYRGILGTYSGEKLAFRDCGGQRNPLFLRLIASLPVFVAVGCSVVITSLPPTYFSIRHILMLGLGLLYLVVSPALTVLLRSRFGLAAVEIKNSVIAALATGSLLVASCGFFFNNCRGWEAWFPRNMGVILSAEAEFQANDHKWFPLTMSLCVATQVFLWLVVKLMCSRGRDVMKLSWKDPVSGPGAMGGQDVELGREQSSHESIQSDTWLVLN